MNIRHDGRIGIIAATVFVIVFSFYQPAHATNESSYKIGYHAGYNNYACLFNGEDCDPPSNNPVLNGCTPSAVTNITACTDGYVHGWQHWCTTNAKDCAEQTTMGRIPEPVYQQAFMPLAHAQVPENVCSNYNNDSSNCHPPIEVQSPAYRAGVVQANYDWDHISRLHTCLGGVGYCPIRCPIGHSQDYCTAYTFGYRDQALYNENG